MNTAQLQSQPDWRLTRERLGAEGLPLELEAYDYYPEGIHIPVSMAGCIIVTGPWCSDKPVETHVTLGTYAVDGDGGDCRMIDLERTELADRVLDLLCKIRHDADWVKNAGEMIDQWFTEGKG